MSGSPTLLPESRLGSTLRRDAWWMEILPVAVVLGGLVFMPRFAPSKMPTISGVRTYRPSTRRSSTLSITGGHSRPRS